MRTGIPLTAEAEGRMPNDEYMVKTCTAAENARRRHRELFHRPGRHADHAAADGAGDGDRSAMAARSTRRGSCSRCRASMARSSPPTTCARAGQIEIERRGDEGVAARRWCGRRRAARHRGQGAGADGVHVAGKTGTAQWGPKNKERTAAWFAGFAPADKPKYAFAAFIRGRSR